MALGLTAAARARKSQVPPPVRTDPIPVLSLSLIECGPVHTAFLEKLEGGPGGSLERADAQTRQLYSLYERHSQEVFREMGQDPEEVTEVGAGPGSPGRGRWGAGGLWRILDRRCSRRHCRSSSLR